MNQFKRSTVVILSTNEKAAYEAAVNDISASEVVVFI